MRNGRKPKVFIGSSKEQLEFARSIQENLYQDFETKVWDQQVFELSDYPLDALNHELAKSDFGVFVLAPDDLMASRGRKFMVPRDNVVFELGMFTGKLGRDHVFMAVPESSKEFRLPSDLFGLTLAFYEPVRRDGSYVAAVASACHKIRRLILQRFPLPAQDSGLVRFGMFSEFTASFEMLIGAATEMTLYFIHSRRWRENHHDQIRGFLDRSKSSLTVFLPNLGNDSLVRTLQSHFDDGLHIPSFIADAYRYFCSLIEQYGDKVEVYLFNLYPAYSFYKFDDVFVIAMYPTTPVRKDVPAFQVTGESSAGIFVLNDIEHLAKESFKTTKKQLRSMIESQEVRPSRNTS